MNNELGRKITSLTLMTIMFAGGITVSGASFAMAPYMPEAIADHDDDATTSGALSVSSTHVMGGAVLGITLTDSSIVATDQQISPPSVSLDGQSVDMTQMTDGSWVAYVVDHESAINLDGSMNENDNDSGFEYGVLCDGGLGARYEVATANQVADKVKDFDITSNPSFYQGWNYGNQKHHYCYDTVDHGDGIGGGQVLFSVLTDAPTVNSNSGTGTNNSGNRNILLNGTTGISAWPFIQALNFSSTMEVEYGAEDVEVEWGANDDNTDLFVDRDIMPDNAMIHLTVVDPGLNYDPTNEDTWIFDAAQETFYFANNGSLSSLDSTKLPTQGASSSLTGGEVSIDGAQNAVIDTTTKGHVGCAGNCIISVGGSPKAVFNTNGTSSYFSYANITLTETDDNSGIFTSFDTETGVSDFKTATDAAVDSQATISYDGNTATIVIGYNDAVATFEAGDSWLPVEEATYTVTDADMNKNPLDDETLDIGDPHDRIPTITTGSPITIADHIGNGFRSCGPGGTVGDTNEAVCISTGSATANDVYYNVFATNTTDNSKRLKITVNGIGGGAPVYPTSTNTLTWLNITTDIPPSDLVNLEGTAAIQYDISSIVDQLSATDVDLYVMHEKTITSDRTQILNASTGTGMIATNVISVISSGNAGSGIADLDDTTGDAAGNAAIDSASTERVGVDGVEDVWGSALSTNQVSIAFLLTHVSGNSLATNGTCAAGGAGCYGEYAIAVDFVNWDQDNQTKIQNAIYRLEAEETGDNTGVFTGTVAYTILNNSTSANPAGDVIGDGTSGFTRGGHSGNANPSSGVPAPSPSFNGDELFLLLGDGLDGVDAPRVSLNDSDTVGGSGTTVDVQLDAVSHTGVAEFDASSYGDADTATITITDLDLNQDNEQREVYTNSSGTFQVMIDDDDTQIVSDQVIIETGVNSGVFVGTFVVPNKLGKDMELQYYDSVDRSGEDSTTYAISSIASADGAVSLDRTSYPVPYAANGLDAGDNTSMTVAAGNVVGTITVTDPDSDDLTFTTSSNFNTCEAGNVKVKLSGTFVYTAAGNCAVDAGSAIQELGPLTQQVAGESGHEIDFTIGGATCTGSNTGVCQTGTSGGTSIPVNSTSIIQVEYIDSADSAGATTTFYDSAIFELHTAQLAVDKDVYIMGQDAVITLTDLDLNLDSDEIEQYDLRLIEWDSDNNSSVLLHNSYCTSGCTLDPSNLTETGANTGVFQTIFTIPTSMTEGGTATSSEQGDEVILTYRDRGLSGENSYGDDELDIEATFSISSFGAIVELDKAVYDWTDTVYITVTAPDWNQNSNSEETIGTAALPINANTRAGKMCTSTTGQAFYNLAETDEDTGVFDGEIALTGFDHTMATSQSYTAASNTCTSDNKGGTLQTAGNMDGITVSYEWVDNSIAIASAIIQWNIGEVEIADSAVSPNGSTVIRVTDVDEDLNSTVVDTFKVDVFSDSDSGGFQATVSETGEDTGVFEAIIYFSDSAATSGLTLRVSEGDTVTVEYTDVTLPGPDYTTSDDITIAATTTVGTTTPPLERAPAANARVVDAFGSSVAEVSVDQQVQIAADVANSQGKEQSFAYLVQVQDANGVTVSLAWITGSLNAGQSMSPALSWTPSASGSYTATVFVWESVDNPVALSPTVTVGIDVV